MRRLTLLLGVILAACGGDSSPTAAADLDIVGTWYRESSTTSDVSSSTLYEWYQFHESGAMAYSWQRSFGGEYGSGVGDLQTLQGTWAGAGGDLRISLADGQEWGFSYSLTQSSDGTPVLKLVDGAGTVYWFYFQGR